MLKEYIKVYLHAPILRPSPSQSPSKFNIVPMVAEALMCRMGSRPILAVTIGTMLNVDGDCNSDGHGVGTCKPTLNVYSSGWCFVDPEDLPYCFDLLRVFSHWARPRTISVARPMKWPKVVTVIGCFWQFHLATEIFSVSLSVKTPLKALKFPKTEECSVRTFYDTYHW